MSNNYFSNSAQNALNNMNPKNAFSGYSSFFKPPTTGASQTPVPVPAPKPNPVTLPNNMNSSNTIYSSKNQPIASKFPVSSKNTSYGNNNGNQSGGGSSTSGNGNNTSGPILGSNGTMQGPSQGTSQYYANKAEGVADEYANLKSAYTPLIKSDQSISGPSGLINRLTDADVAARNSEIAGLQGQANQYNNLLGTSLPKTITAGEMAYNPLSGTSQINSENQSSSAQRLANVGGQSAITGLGSSQVGLEATQNQIKNLRQQIGLTGNPTDITVLNGIISDVVNHIGSPRLASFRTMIGALANAVSSDNPKLSEQLSNFAGDGLGNASPQVINSAIAAAQQAIQAKQQANQQIINGGQGGGGNAYGGLI